MRIGLFGGTFNPVHLGHMTMLSTCKREFHLDLICVIPTGISYHKAMDEAVSPEARLTMTRLALAEIEGIKVLDVDIKRGTKTYTVDTYHDVLKLLGPHEYFFIMGEDSLDYVETWKEAPYLFQVLQWIVIRRSGSDRPIEELMQELRLKYQAKIHLSEMSPMAISSSQCRESIRHWYQTGSEQDWEQLCHWIPQVELSYIIQHHFYKNEGVVDHG